MRLSTRAAHHPCNPVFTRSFAATQGLRDLRHLLLVEELEHGAAKAVINPLTKLMGAGKATAAGPTPAEKITAHFAAVNALVAGPPGQAPIDQVTAQVKQIQLKMSGMGTGVGETNPLDALAKSGVRFDRN